MSEARSANNDPSMDDILASIRKIISDDEARAQVGRQQASNPSTRPTVAASAQPQPDTAGRDDVLLLTDLIEEPRSGPADARPMPMPMPRIDPAQAAEMPQPSGR